MLRIRWSKVLEGILFALMSRGKDRFICDPQAGYEFTAPWRKDPEGMVRDEAVGSKLEGEWPCLARTLISLIHH